LYFIIAVYVVLSIPYIGLSIIKYLRNRNMRAPYVHIPHVCFIIRASIVEYINDVIALWHDGASVLHCKKINHCISVLEITAFKSDSA